MIQMPKISWMECPRTSLPSWGWLPRTVAVWSWCVVGTESSGTARRCSPAPRRTTASVAPSTRSAWQRGLQPKSWMITVIVMIMIITITATATALMITNMSRLMVKQILTIGKIVNIQKLSLFMLVFYIVLSFMKLQSLKMLVFGTLDVTSMRKMHAFWIRWRMLQVLVFQKRKSLMIWRQSRLKTLP